jgi:hypothetical protein
MIRTEEQAERSERTSNIQRSTSNVELLPASSCDYAATGRGLFSRWYPESSIRVNLGGVGLLLKPTARPIIISLLPRGLLGGLDRCRKGHRQKTRS